VVVIAAWSAPHSAAVLPQSLYHPDPHGPTLRLLETGVACHGTESSEERGPVAVIAAPVIAARSLFGALTAARPATDPFPPGAEIRLRSFADLAAQSIANERAQAALRASRARIVETADEARRRLERNLHDGAQQRLVSVALTLRVARACVTADPAMAAKLLDDAAGELATGLEELREIARGIHPAILSEHGLRHALEALAERLPVAVAVDAPEDRLPQDVEATAYYIVAEALTNVAKHAGAASARASVRRDGAVLRCEVSDDGRGGADTAGGTGLLGLRDRAEAAGGTLTVRSPAGGGTTVTATLPL
jgi:signal transduction histidine kinase